MLKRTYDPTRPYPYAEYGRMSDPGQNRRSPDQQFASISETINRLRYPWRKVRSYRDDGISGRYVRKRPGLQAMLRDIAAGLITIDLVVCDTYERLGRAEEIAMIRHKLMTDHGILVVTADTSFADPTGVVGKAVGMVESVRSTEDGRIKCHNVIRGKKDTARLKRWPGGPRPFGYQFKKLVDNTSGEPVVYTVLEPHPEEGPVMFCTFMQAHATGWGATRLARWYNENPAIPEKFKPTCEFTIGRRLSNRIYVGELVWGETCTGIVNDTRVVEPNPEDEIVRIADFCEPIISAEIFATVNALRTARGTAVADARRRASGRDGKLIQPLSRGLTLKYLLSGLARCGHCGASMRPVPSGRRSKSGRSYVYYVCPRFYAGGCDNGRSVPEDRLREAAISRLRSRLFPPPEREGELPEWFPGLVAQVRHELAELRQAEPDRSQAVQHELREIDDKLKGWSLTLANPQLATSVRSDIESEYEAAKCRKQELATILAEDRALEGYVEAALDARQVLDRLHRLSDVLAAGNATLANLELSRHIDRIDCHRDGRIVLRGTMLGLFEGAVELLNCDDGPAASAGNQEQGNRKVRPRRRTRLRLDDLSAGGDLGFGDLDTSLDPRRFEGLAEDFMWEEVLFVSHILSWAEKHALEVAKRRAEGLTIERLAVHFGKTPPTIRSALRHANRMDPSVCELPKKMPRPCWAKDHATEVAELKSQGMSTVEIAKHFGKSDTTIRAALKAARQSTDPATVPDDGTDTE